MNKVYIMIKISASFHFQLNFQTFFLTVWATHMRSLNEICSKVTAERKVAHFNKYLKKLTL